jgi:hypothetical protein
MSDEKAKLTGFVSGTGGGSMGWCVVASRSRNCERPRAGSANPYIRLSGEYAHGLAIDPRVR